MSKFSYKTLFIIFFFLLIGVVVLSRFVLPNKKVSASWWNESWSYRRAISIDNSSGSNLTDFQVSISIGTSALIASGKMQSDCDDIRITDQNGQLLPYWIEENNPGCNQITDTKVWIKASSIPTSGGLIYFYYGNSQADNVEDGKNVFDFFDDFSNFSSWTGDTNFFATATDGSRTVLKITGSVAPGEIFKPMTVPNNYIVEVAIKDSNETSNSPHPGLVFASNGTTSNYNGIYLRSQGNELVGANNGSYGSPAGSVNIDANWHTYKTTIVGGTLVSLIVDNSTQVATFNNWNITTSNSHIGLWSHSFEADGFFDSLFVRKYASSDPTPTLQSEEVGTAPVAYWKFDEGAGNTAYDSSSNKINANLTNSKWETGINGNAFDGSSGGSISIPDNNLLDISNNLTISFWYYPRSTHTNYANHPINKWSGTGDANFVFYEFGNGGSGNTYMWYANRGGSWGNISNTWTPSSLNKWYFITLTYNSTTGGQLYIDSKPVGGKTGSGLLATNNSTFYALNNTSSSQPSIDELKIYNYIRTADQIKQDYNSRGSSKGTSVNLGVKSNTAPSLKSSLVAHWKFDENNGNTIYDSVSSNHGTFGTGNSSPTWSNDGKFSKAVSFNGIGSEVVLNNNISVGSTNWSISWWMKKSNNSYETIFSRSKDGSSGYIAIKADNSIVLESYTNNIWYPSLSTGINTGDNKWHNYSFVFSSQDSKLYTDGKLTDTETPNSDAANFVIRYIGSKQGAAYGTWFSGLLDEVKIYNTALTADEVKQDYNQGAAIQFGSTNQTIGGTTTSLEYCIPGDTTYCAPPVAEWKMDEGVGTSTVDTSGNNKNGTFNNSPTWVQGKIGKALNFSYANNDSVTTTFNSQLTSYTAEAWIKPTGFESGNWNTIMATSSSYALWFELTSSGEISAHAFTTSTSAETATNGANIEIEKWYHVAVSATQNGTATIYVNGIGLTSFTAGNDNWSGSDVITIGDLRASRNLNFNGTIDHVKIYNYARTPAQIAYDYNKGGPIGWWKFDECQGNIAYDWSGIGNTGVINIGASGSQTSLGTCQVGTSAAWTNGATGKTNSSLNFDGTDDYINFGDLNSLEGMNGITTSAWIYRTIDKGSHESIISKFWDGTDRSYWTFIDGSSDKFRCLIPSDTDNDNDSAFGSVINLNEWYFVTCTWDNISHLIKAYVNGKLIGQSAQNGNTVRTNNTPIQIARDSSSSYFSGQIDDVRIYNYALTSEQVKTVYNGGSVNFQ